MPNRPGNSKNSPRALARIQQREEAVAMRLMGLTYKKIGERLGVTNVRAYQIVTDALAEIEAKTSEDLEQVKRVELERLDKMTVGLYPQAMRGDAQAVEKMLRIMERRAKMIGIDAPTKVAPTDPTGGREYVPVPQAKSLEEFTAWQKQQSK